MTAFDRLSRMCGPQVPPELLALLGEHRAQVRAEGLSESERVFLAFALGLARDVMASRGDEFPDEDHAALASLRRMATTPASSVPVPDNTTGDEGELERLRAERDAYCDRVDTLTAVAKGNKRHVQEMYADLQKAHAERDELKSRLSAVLDMCDREQRHAMRWQDPIPVPEWVAVVQRAALGDAPKAGDPR